MNSSRPAAQRIQMHGLDIARFLAAFIVMLYHLGYSTWAMGKTTASVITAGSGARFPEIAALASFGWVGVEIFFVISGFVILYSATNSTARSFAWARVIRLYPAAAASATLSLLALLLVRGGWPALAGQYLRSITLWPFGPWLDGVYWTLGVEMVFYLVVLLILAAGRQAKLFTAMNMIGLLSCAFLAGMLALYALDGIAAVGGMMRSSRFITLGLLPHGVFFATGALLFKSTQAPLSRREGVWLALFLCFGLVEILLEASLKTFRDLTPLAPGLMFLPALIWAAAIGAIALSSRHNDRAAAVAAALRLPTRKLGLVTYPLYLIHATVGSALFVLLAALALPPYVALAVSMAGCIALAWMTVDCFELPLQGRLKKLVARPGPAGSAQPHA